MIYAFGDFELDTDRVELRCAGVLIDVEPKVYDLLLLLAQNPGKIITRDEMIETLWQNRIVSDAAVASCLKSARKALDDQRSDNHFIKTIRGRGVRFLAKVRVVPDSSAPNLKSVLSLSQTEAAVENHEAEVLNQPSIAVLPFGALGDLTISRGVAEAMPHDLILELSRLRWLFVIARGSSFKYRSGVEDICEVGSRLHVSYLLTGYVESFNSDLTVLTELSDCHTGRVIWADRHRLKLDQIHEMRQTLTSEIISVLEIQISAYEANRARLKSPDNLDAWASYHLGLKHMYRFTAEDNERAAAYFKKAASCEPNFARAHAGLSFTHFQNAFVKYKDNPEFEIEQARRFAEISVDLDEFDPFANFNLGRSFWLEGRLEEGQTWLNRAVQFNPNYAQGVYCNGITATLMGNAESGQLFVDKAMRLSPLDPLYYAMSATRALTHMLRGDTEAAVNWAEIGMNSPGAHIHIKIIALIAYALHGREDDARALATLINKSGNLVTASDFLRAFPFRQSNDRSLILKILNKYGFKD